MKKLCEWFRSKIELLWNDKKLALIMILHVLLIALHVYEWQVGNIEYHWYLRAGGCAVIAFCIFFFGRKGLSYGLMIFSCVLVYVNNFYNYATIFFMLIAIGANPRIKKVAPWVYLVNVFIAYSQKRLGITPFLIHVIYCVMFGTKMNYIFEIHKPDTLNLTEDERMILAELHSGKKQKEIECFSQPTITAKLKSARERNMCESTGELVARYGAEIAS